MAIISLNVKLCAFLDLIAFSEGTDPNPGTHDHGYDVLVAGIEAKNYSRDYSTHPFANGRAPILVTKGPPPIHSTASGRYQIGLDMWRDLAEVGKLGTFGPHNQDLAALELLRANGAIELILAGDIEEAIDRVCAIWTSFPGDLFHQNPHDLSLLTAKYTALLTAA